MSDFLVGIDAGTMGCKSIVFDLGDNVPGQNYRECPCAHPGPGLVEQRHEDIIPLLAGSCREAAAAFDVSPEEIRAIVFSSQVPLLALADAEGNLIRDFLSWQGLRGAPYILKLRETYGAERFYLETGDPLEMNGAAPRRAWLRDNEPENRARTEWFLSKWEFPLKEWGADGYWTDLLSASREGMLDVDSMQWLRGIHDLIGVPVEKCAHLVIPPGKVVGRTGKDIACCVGLAEGILLCLGAHDQNCSTSGGGVVRGGDCVMVMGTFGFCYAVMDKPLRDPARKLAVRPNHGMGNWTIEAFLNTSASSLRWYRDTFYREECATGEAVGVGPYDIITSQARRSPTGANGVMFLPYLAGVSGARQNPQVRANINGMVFITTKGDVVRAVLEGICFEVCDILDAQAAAGIEAGTIRLVDGAAKSALWLQMLADVLQRPIETLRTSEVGCLGAAMCAGVGTGLYSSCEEAAAWVVAVAGRFDPDPTAGAAYNQAFRCFVDLYEGLDTGIF